MHIEHTAMLVDDCDEARAAVGAQFAGVPRSEPHGQVVFVGVAGNRWDLLGPPAGGHRSID